MKANEISQIEFIKDCLRKGERRKSILAKFGKKWQSTATRTFDRLLKESKTKLDSELKTIEKETIVSIGKEIKRRKIKIMSVLERQEYLQKLITGEIKVKKPFVIGGKIMEYPSEPDHNDRLKALAELNKMRGDYAPTKSVVQNFNQEVPLFPETIKDKKQNS